MTIALNMISLLGGLAMFLYGMRLMGANLKEGSSGTLKLFFWVWQSLPSSSLPRQRS